MQAIKTVFFLISFIHLSISHAEINQYFQNIRQNPQSLYLFLKKMPKGGDLHYHLAGSAYPETMLKLAATGPYCMNLKDFSIEKAENCTGISSKKLIETQPAYDKVIEAWSMKNFIPGNETGHDHFFNSFLKFLPLIADYEGELLASILQHAGNQHVLYLEIMVLPDEARSAAFGDLVKNIPDLAQKRKLLLANPDFQNNIRATITSNDQALHKARHILHCDAANAQEGCEVAVKFQYYNLREQPLDNLFAQALNGFEAASRSHNLVAVNLVQPEDGLISLKDYRKQMQIFQFLHQQYPGVHIALHAGELAFEDVSPEDITFHIQEAIFTGKAERIGHGVTVGYEDNLEKTLDYMKKNAIPVEINLTSNQKILNIEGKQHPLRFYLKQGIPVVLATDDEGVLRTNLTRQYQKAVEEHGLDYATIKQINRNGLTYSFLPGMSIWEDAVKAVPVKACSDWQSPECHVFIRKNAKAALQWKLEQELQAFEKGF